MEKIPKEVLYLNIWDYWYYGVMVIGWYFSLFIFCFIILAFASIGIKNDNKNTLVAFFLSFPIGLAISYYFPYWVMKNNYVVIQYFVAWFSYPEQFVSLIGDTTSTPFIKLIKLILWLFYICLALIVLVWYVVGYSFVLVFKIFLWIIAGITYFFTSRSVWLDISFLGFLYSGYSKQEVKEIREIIWVLFPLFYVLSFSFIKFSYLTALFTFDSFARHPLEGVITQKIDRKMPIFFIGIAFLLIGLVGVLFDNQVIGLFKKNSKNNYIIESKTEKKLKKKPLEKEYTKKQKEINLNVAIIGVNIEKYEKGEIVSLNLTKEQEYLINSLKYFDDYPKDKKFMEFLIQKLERLKIKQLREDSKKSYGFN